MNLGSKAVSFLSGEWMLSSGRPNGGDVVIFRTVWVGSILIAVMAVIQALAAPASLGCAGVDVIWLNVLKMLSNTQGPVVYGAVYVALYARFASQWTYMANLYNQIKQTEITAPKPLRRKVLAQWKAGYIEDAFATHMATKPVVAGVIRAWYAESDVKQAFACHTNNHHEIIGWLKKHNVL